MTKKEIKRLSQFDVPLFKDKDRRKVILLIHRKTRQGFVVVAHLGCFYLVKFLELTSSNWYLYNSFAPCSCMANISRITRQVTNIQKSMIKWKSFQMCRLFEKPFKETAQFISSKMWAGIEATLLLLPGDRFF